MTIVVVTSTHAIQKCNCAWHIVQAWSTVQDLPHPPLSAPLTQPNPLPILTGVHKCSSHIKNDPGGEDPDTL